MTTLVIWGEDDHEVRAKALATAYSTTAVSIRSAPKAVAGLDTLVFWGHGDTTAFCHLSPADFVACVVAWRALNPGLETVEMLTCNARHSQTSTDSYTDQVVTALSRRQARAVDKVRFKALPVAVTKSGQTCKWSILKWHGGSATWAYVAAPSRDMVNYHDKNMHDAVVMLENFMKPRGSADGLRNAFAAYSDMTAMLATHPYAIKKKFDKAQLDDFNRELSKTKNDTYIIAGTLGMLRWLTVDIK